MDYKKKYEQACERMKAWAEGKYPECFDSAQKTAELIFPELKESEGEGIREKLINTFEFYNQAMDSPYLLGVHKKDIIAWLEKQDKTDSSINWHDVSEKPEKNREVLCEWVGSNNCIWHDVTFYNPANEAFWNYGRQVDYVTRWCYIDELEKQGKTRKITHEEICKSYGIPDIGEFSDGYHTFNGLYKQRMILFAVLVKTYKDRAWKSWKHEDGLNCFGGGWFIVGIDTPAGTYTYHYEAKDWDRFDCKILDKAKHWDGHDESDVERLFSLLEKQGEQKSNYCNPEVDLSNCSEEYRKAYYDGYNKCNRDWHRQSEQKESPCDRCKKAQPSHSCQDITELGRCYLEHEKQGEQKQPKELTNSEFVEKCKGLSRLEQHILALVPTRPIDAIKVDARTVRYLVEQEQGEQKPADTPKFKVEKGEWYICTQTFVLRGENVVIKGQVYKSNQNGAIEGENQHLFIDTLDGKASDYFRPWTIKDAKDGDVLVDVYGNIGIFEQYDDFDWTSYCSLGVNGGFQHFKVEHENEKTYPATKEQRDTLMKAMADAGYEWDAEKKELKKIDQTPAWSNTDLISLGYLAYFVDNNGDKFYGKNKSNVVKWIYSLANLTAPQQEWSEEDKKKLNRIYNLLAEAADEYAFDSKCRLIDDKECLELQDFIESLKDRVQSQPKQEWSEKDEVGFGDATWAIEQARTIAKDENDMGNLWYAEHWLNSLKERYTWKPSEEQMDCLNSILRFGNVSQTSYKHLNSLINDLKKLKG